MATGQAPRVSLPFPAAAAATPLPAHPRLLRLGGAGTSGGAARPPLRSSAAVASSKMKRTTPRLVVSVAGYGGVDAEAPRYTDAEAAPASVPRSVPVRVAYELQQAGHRYLDVRTEGEFSAGHPQGAVNIPYMNKTGSGMTKNAHFVEQVPRIFGKDDEIIVGCQIGKRSLMAATELCSAGFTAVTDIAGGFSSWKENELPITQ